MKARLIEIRQENKNVYSFIFEPERPVERTAGQFVRYVLPHQNVDDRGNGRYFTVASAPYEKFLQITTRFSDPSSSFKSALKQLPLGSEIQFDEPEGEFVVKDFTKNYIFVAGGIGVTPVRSILAEAEHNAQQLKAQVLYASKEQDILFKKQLDDFCAHNPTLSVTYIKDAEQTLTASLTKVVRSTEDTYVYITGPEPMVEQFTVTTKKLGIDTRHIQTDFFDGYVSIG